MVIKWAWEADADRLAKLLKACLKAGHHPCQWKEAIVCVIPKANCADYTLAKYFRPISLFECLGKLLEKVVAKLIYRDIVTPHGLSALSCTYIPTPCVPPDYSYRTLIAFLDLRVI